MYPFEITVHIYRRPHMRCDQLEMELYMGRNVLDQIFDKEVVDETITQLRLSFPERWMNIVEERSLFNRLQKYCPNLKSVFIKTQSVYIIQSTPAASCFILKGPEEQAGAKLPQESDTGRLYFPNMNNVVGPGLTVLGGTR